VRLWAKLEGHNPDRQRQGPHRQGDGGRRREDRAGWPRGRPWSSRPAATPASPWPWWPGSAATGWSWSCPRTPRPSAASCWSCTGPRWSLAGRRRLQRGHRPGRGAGRPAPRLGDALPVRQPGERDRPLRDHRPRDLARPARGDPLRGRPRHQRHPGRGGPLPQGAEPGRAGGGGRARVRRPGLRAAQPGRGVRAPDLRGAGARPAHQGRLARRPGPDPPAGRDRGRVRRHLHRGHPARRPAGGRAAGPGRHRRPRPRRRLEVPVHRRLRGRPGRRRGRPRGQLWA
jgi:hypothetical protein